MLREKDARKELENLNRLRENREITISVYDRARERIFQNIGFDEESGERHRYPTRKRMARIAPPSKLNKLQTVSSKFDKSQFVVADDEQDFSHQTSDEEYNIHFNIDHYLQSDDEEEEEEEKKEDSLLDDISVFTEDEAVDIFPKKPIQVRALEIREVSKFPPNFFKHVIT